jgi:uncharacterized membrane protein YccF (DUF307 family)
MRRLIRNPLVILVVFWGGLWLLLRAHLASAFDGIVLPFLLALSVLAVIQMVRRRSFTPYGQTALMSDRLRRWVLDEPEEHKPTR